MHKRWKRRLMGGLGGWLAVILLSARPAAGLYLDDARTVFFTSVFYNQFRLRTEEPRGLNTRVGDWTPLQHRYFVDPQLRVNVMPWVRNFPGGNAVAETLGLEEVSFFFNPRFEYDGIYDYGPDAFRDELAPRLQKGSRFRIFEMYGDFGFAGGWLNIRAGRQNVSWGETDGFRLLDRINPLDNSFGGFQIPLDERRVPLTMLRATLRLEDLPEWDISNSALEVFVAPDKGLPKGAPGLTPWGVQGAPLSPLVAPTLVGNIARLGPPQGNQLDRPDLSLGDSRWGARLLWTWQDISFTLAHMSTYPDGPTPSLQLNRQEQPVIKLRFPNMQVTGFTASSPLPAPFSYTVFRSEVAGFFGEPFFIEEMNFALGQRLPKRNVIRGVIGLDHNQWIRSLNARQTFFITGQLFYTNIQGRLTGLKTPLVTTDFRGRSLNRFVDVDRESFLSTLTVNTLYPGVPMYIFNPQVQPQVTFFYNWEGAWLFQPQLVFIRDPWRFRIEWNWLEGHSIDIGLLQDKDNLAFRIDYLL